MKWNPVSGARNDNEWDTDDTELTDCQQQLIKKILGKSVLLIRPFNV
jgi:hypothetical protein